MVTGPRVRNRRPKIGREGHAVKCGQKIFGLPSAWSPNRNVVSNPSAWSPKSQRGLRSCLAAHHGRGRVAGAARERAQLRRHCPGWRAVGPMLQAETSGWRAGPLGAAAAAGLIVTMFTAKKREVHAQAQQASGHRAQWSFARARNTTPVTSPCYKHIRRGRSRRARPSCRNAKETTESLVSAFHPTLLKFILHASKFAFICSSWFGFFPSSSSLSRFPSIDNGGKLLNEV